MVASWVGSWVVEAMKGRTRCLRYRGWLGLFIGENRGVGRREKRRESAMKGEHSSRICSKDADEHSSREGRREVRDDKAVKREKSERKREFARVAKEERDRGRKRMGRRC